MHSSKHKKENLSQQIIFLFGALIHTKSQANNDQHGE